MNRTERKNKLQANRDAAAARQTAHAAAKLGGTQADRHAAKAEAKAKTKARFEANRKPPQLVKDGDREYIQGNDTRAPEEQIQERFLKDKAARAALTATRREATAEARAAYQADRKQKIVAAVAARRERVGSA